MSLNHARFAGTMNEILPMTELFYSGYKTNTFIVMAIK